MCALCKFPNFQLMHIWFNFFLNLNYVPQIFKIIPDHPKIFQNIMRMSFVSYCVVYLYLSFLTKLKFYICHIPHNPHSITFWMLSVYNQEQSITTYLRLPNEIFFEFHSHFSSYRKYNIDECEKNWSYFEQIIRT